MRSALPQGHSGQRRRRAHTPFARLSPGADIVGALSDASFDVLSLSPQGELELADVSVGARTAVRFGAEGPGLPPNVLARTRTVRIAMAGDFDSLNVAATSGIVLHQIAAQARPRF